MIFEVAADDVPQGETIRCLLVRHFCRLLAIYMISNFQLQQDIHEVRYAKLRAELAAAKASDAIAMHHLALMEITAIRPFFTQSMDVFNKIYEARVAAEQSGDL